MYARKQRLQLCVLCGLHTTIAEHGKGKGGHLIKIKLWKDKKVKWWKDYDFLNLYSILALKKQIEWSNFFGKTLSLDSMFMEKILFQAPAAIQWIFYFFLRIWVLCLERAKIHKLWKL
jgi:hypothetical protein